MSKKVRGCIGALVGILLLSCVDEKAVNVAFYQSGLSWYVFSSTSENALKVVKSFDELRASSWKPRSRALFTTDFVRSTALKASAAIVSSRGLVLLDDSTGQLQAIVPGSSLEWSGYRTGEAFVADRKLFFHVFQSGSVVKSPAVSLGWWTTREPRVAFLPVPSQIKNPIQQAFAFDYATVGTDHPVLGILWRATFGDEVAYRKSTFDLKSFEESELVEADFESPGGVLRDLPPELAGAAEALANKIKATVRTIELRRIDEPVTRQIWFENAADSASAFLGSRSSSMLSRDGLLSLQFSGESTGRVYRLPDLGHTGRYTAVMELDHGVLIAWELSFRGYVGPSGLVYVPFPVFSR